jgi:hypothetical protein
MARLGRLSVAIMSVAIINVSQLTCSLENASTFDDI